jgi:SAM-dependent methyltransferase
MTPSPTVAAPAAVPSSPAVPGPTPALQRELKSRLDKLSRVFDLAEVRTAPLAAEQVVRYYEDCHDAYRKYHSRDGAVHMALNDGDRFDPDGFFGQLRRIEAGWAERPAPPKAVLELAFGQGFNLEYLARRHAGQRVLGIDLTPAHLHIAQQRVARAGLANVELVLGDFHHLPQASASVDAVFCIEAFCYATELPRALAEVRRVLRPGGRFTLFDGYYTRPLAQMDTDAALAAELVARGMAMDTLQVQDDLLAAARHAGFVPAPAVALDAEVMPSLRRLERVTGAVIRWPWLGRRALARRSALRGRNILAGYLMRTAVAMGLIGYRQLVLDVPH